MTTPLDKSSSTRVLLLIAAVLVATAFAIWDTSRGIAALVGAVVGLLNWFALRWLTGRIVGSGEGSGVSKAGVSLLLVGKIGLLMAVVFVLINRVRVDPIGLAFGLGVLFIGPVVAGVIAGTERPTNRSAGSNPEQPLNPNAGMAAREER